MITIPTSGLWSAIAGHLNGNFGNVADTAVGEYIATSLPIQLTDTYLVVTSWSTRNDSIGITESSGEFTVTNAAIHLSTLSRAYRNDDQNPAAVVILSVLVEKDEGSGWETVFENSSTMSSATSATEPATTSFTNSFVPFFIAGEKLRVSFKATDNGATPSGTYLTNVGVSSVSVGNIPEV